ncbi:MAG: hypothetical protein OMM_07187 [Candidatus Magnetoglobus multicellularis str. Araruama]|uniref:Uncharacterized protein n=1 Tax=Candidatus Magnetoglobus multicellularis str. Araruama TaxID=890399 RepID=A0A1V1PDQ3_9BACT|nr:MAG: hypothetical protein OMM_07187 [Candidatus Magnetoglobus multicellularis str. Araruama]
MDIGDFIFIFIAVLVILGRVLSWLLQQFVDKPADKSDSTDSADTKKQPGIMDYVVDFLRSLEDGKETQRTESQWSRLDAQHYYAEPDDHFIEETHVPVSVPKESISDPQNVIVPQKKKAETPRIQVQKKYGPRQLNLKEAIIHYEVFAPPLSLRQEY